MYPPLRLPRDYGLRGLLATESRGDRTLVGGLGRLEPLAFDQKLDDRRRHLGQLAARAHATPICPLPLGPASTETTGGTVFVHGWNGFCPRMEHRVPLSILFSSSLSNKKEEQS
jgi:hypothetical protein